MEDRCLICGAIIPEGRQICPICEQNAENKQKEKEKADED